jgi:hypothetical protein
VPTVTIGNVAATISYAGWVPDSIAGLYQINVQIPASNSTFTDASGVTGALPANGNSLHLPVVVTAGTGRVSQATGVLLYVHGALKVVSSGQTTGASTVAWTGTTITPSEGTSPYTFAVTTGTLPAGLTLDANAGTISGTPTTPGSATVTITATDNGGWTGKVTITFTIT